MNKALKTLAAMRQNARDISWEDFVGVLSHFGGWVEKKKGSKRIFHLQGRKAFFHEPHGKGGNKARPYQIEDFLDFLRLIGLI